MGHSTGNTFGTRAAIGRRRFIIGTAGAAAGLLVVRTGFDPSGAGAGVVLPDNPFTLGVASGDPLPDRVILWTRLAPDPLDGGGMPATDVGVGWEVATDQGFTDVVASGTALAVPGYAHSVHVDATGLEPDTGYWYRFSIGGHDSPVGRTRTAPARGCTADSLRFGFASCQNWTGGYYPAHGHLAQEGCDLVFFLGDYIYEGGTGMGAVRPHNSDEIFTLAEYRNRYGLYKSDPDLQASHAACPWIVTWDDHEVDNNYAGEIHEGGDPVAQFLARRAVAYQAWWEHQPVRLAPPDGPDLRIYRSFEWGGLASLFVLDGRQYRSDQACGDGIQPVCDEWSVPERSMLGETQEDWLGAGLRGSDATWNVIANQTVFSALPLAGSFNMDQWDGYPAARRRLLEVMARPEVLNPLVVTGDIHAAGIAEIRADFDDENAPVIGTELVGTSISSSFPEALIDAAEGIIGGLPWVKYVNARQRGYTVVDVTHDRMRATYRVVDGVSTRSSPVSTARVHEVEAVGQGACLRPVDGPEGPAGPPGAPVAVTPRFTG
jgi:alkaline phosphatase D